MRVLFGTSMILAASILGCGGLEGDLNNSVKTVKLQGKTMGTTYHITYLDSTENVLQAAIDSLLVAINLEVSTYIDSATISRFNKTEQPMSFDATHKPFHFINNLKQARDIWKITNAAFDPTVMPLVQYWGFGTEKRAVTRIDSLKVDSLRQLVGFDEIKWSDVDGFNIQKTKSGLQLDFSALAKGYGVDQIAILFIKNGIEDFMIEIGGEVYAQGKNPQGKWWTIGINTPSAESKIGEYEVVVELQNEALATSGNYRNYYELDGKKYGHIINPTSGFPEQSQLLSASVFAKDCATADALATAFMVMGLDSAFALATALQDVNAYFIYGDDKGGLSAKYTEGVKLMLKN